jgi:hypothetical protein
LNDQVISMHAIRWNCVRNSAGWGFRIFSCFQTSSYVEYYVLIFLIFFARAARTRRFIDFNPSLLWKWAGIRLLCAARDSQHSGSVRLYGSISLAEEEERTTSVAIVLEDAFLSSLQTFWISVRHRSWGRVMMLFVLQRVFFRLQPAISYQPSATIHQLPSCC